MSEIKFKTDSDRVGFLVEVGRLDLLDAESIPQEVFETFIKRRTGTVKRLKDFRKSQIAKSAWRGNRYKYMKGIRRYHRSTKGKRFHRSLGRFLATRYSLGYRRKGDQTKPTKPSRQKSESLELMKGLVLKGLSSARTHSYIELDYFMPLSELVDYQLFLDYALPRLQHMEHKLNEDVTYEFDDDEYELFLRITDPEELQNCIAETFDLDIDDVNSAWRNELSGLDQEGTYFLTQLFETVIEKLI